MTRAATKLLAVVCLASLATVARAAEPASHQSDQPIWLACRAHGSVQLGDAGPWRQEDTAVFVFDPATKRFGLVVKVNGRNQLVTSGQHLVDAKGTVWTVPESSVDASKLSIDVSQAPSIDAPSYVPAVYHWSVDRDGYVAHVHVDVAVGSSLSWELAGFCRVRHAQPLD